MILVVDTSILIDHLRGKPEAKELLTAAYDRGDRLAASVLTKVEVRAGARPNEKAVTGRLLKALEWIPVDDELAESAGALAEKWIRSHPGIEVTDYVIAATVKRLGARLWTRNVKHFPMISGLESPY